MAVFRLFNYGPNNVSNFRNLLCSSNAFKIFKDQRATITYKDLEKLGIPIPPKRPMSPYIKFVKTVRPKLLQDQPNLTPNQIVKVASQKWSEYNPEEKEKMHQEYRSLMQIYLSNFEKYKNSITSEQKELIQNEKQKQKRAKESAQISEKRLNLGRPKRPTTSFLKFLLEKKTQRNSTLNYTEWLKQIGKEWENLSQIEKEKYKEQTKIELQKYRADLSLWEESMIREGHLDIVRNKELIDSKSVQRGSNKIQHKS